MNQIYLLNFGLGSGIRLYLHFRIDVVCHLCYSSHVVDEVA